MFKSHIDTVTSTATALIGTAFVAAALVGIASPARATEPAHAPQTTETTARPNG